MMEESQFSNHIQADADNAGYLDNFNQLTKYDLKKLEEKSKSKKEIIWDRVVCFFPGLITIFHFTEYYFIDNYGTNRATYLYSFILLGLIIYFLGRATLAMMKESHMVKWRIKAPLYTLIIFILMIYDILTLKTATLLLPYFPWVDQIANAIISDLEFLFRSTLASLNLLFQGYLIGAGLGIITGILCGYFEQVNYWISPFTTVIGSIPTTTWIPIVMVLASSLKNGAIFIVALGVFFALTNASFSGVRNIDPSLYEMARTLGANQYQLISRVTLPSILPSVFSGLIQGMSTACTSLIVAEMIGVESGLGWYITWQKNWAEYDKMYGGIIVVCLMFLAVNFLLKYLENKLLKWKDA